MKRLFTTMLLCCMATILAAQTTIINKQVKDFPDVYDLSTPLNAGITIYHLFTINGDATLWRSTSSYMNPTSHEKGKVHNRIIEEDVKMQRLNDTIKEMIVYKDSIARLIIKINNSNRYSIWDLVFEDGKWLYLHDNGGGWALENWREHFHTYAPDWLNQLRRSLEVRTVSTDTLAFVNYVKQHGAEPKDFLLEALANHPLVIYGEIHRRKISWDLLSSVLSDPRFPEIVGTIFVEMPAYQQEEFDRFYASKEMDVEILLDIMRSVQTTGWVDKGEYEFLINLWKLNQMLPADKKIKVVPTDEQLPWKFIKTQEDFEKYDESLIDRNTRMADVIEHTMKTKTDKRNSLFITGYMHAHKSHVPGGYSSAEGQEPALTAGAQLVQRFSDKDVFTILQHVPWMTNTRGAFGLVRQGLFDYIFEINEGKPIAFYLDGSPFGAEPFDADFDMSFDNKAGNYADNFDGYIFLQPLRDEDADYMFYDIWSDKFIDEVKRRLTFINRDINRWFGIEGEVTKEKIIETYKEYEGKKRWSYLFE